MFFIEGYSGCKISLYRNEGISVVRKHAPSLEYSNRLSLQAEKQKKFSKIPINGVHIPKVLSSRKINGMFEFDMEYVPYMDTITFLNVASKADINILWKNIEFFIETCIRLSKPVILKPDIYYNKFLNVSDKILIKETAVSNFLNDCQKIFSSINECSIYEGFCHGDLTFSNIMVSKKCDIYLIDFLDTFFESPIQDIVKLRQDTKYGWTQNLYNRSYDKKRMSILTNHFDNIIHDKFSKFEFYNNLYHPTQLLNLLRILPYTRDKQTFYNIVKLCEGIINEC